VKKFGRFLVALFAVAVIIFAGGSIYSQFTGTSFDVGMVQDIAGSTLGVFTGEGTFVFENTETGETVTLQGSELADYESEYTVYNSSVYRDSLSSDDVVLYNALLYAMEHTFDSIEISSNYQISSEETDRIVQYVALDCPLFEQNIYYSVASNVSGNTINMPKLGSSHWEKQMIAFAEAQRIVDSMPVNLTGDYEKAWYLYSALAEGSVYVDNINGEGTEETLYDMLINKESVCDGFANALSLVYSMAGIESFEKNNTSIDPGHTWVTAEIDGHYYNFDLTQDVTMQEDGAQLQSSTYPYYYFCISDALVSLDDYPDSHPTCSDTSYDFAYCDLFFTDEESSTVISETSDFLNTHFSRDDVVLMFNRSITQDEMDLYLEGIAGNLSSFGILYSTYMPDESRSIVRFYTE
jgi:hypothetical protein